MGLTPDAVLRPELSSKLGLSVYAEHIAHAGYAHPDLHAISLRVAECDALEQGKVDARTASSLFVACHEIGHVLLDTRDEDKANEYAFTHFKLYARRLAFTRRQAGRLFKLCPYT